MVFIVTFNNMINPEWFGLGVWRDIALWLEAESPNPWSCAAMGELVSVTVTVVVSKLTRPLPEAHMARLFPAA